MSYLILQTTITAQWQSLIKEAEDSSHLILGEELESYLVFLLARFTGKPEIAKSVLALDFLQSAELRGQLQQNELRDVGDKCLLIAGLFPGRAQKKRVKISYFVRIGQSAYSVLASLSKFKTAELYKTLGEHFVPLMDVLHVVRELTGPMSGLTVIEAQELWDDTASEHALAVLRRYTKAMPIAGCDPLTRKDWH